MKLQVQIAILPFLVQIWALKLSSVSKKRNKLEWGGFHYLFIQHNLTCLGVDIKKPVKCQSMYSEIEYNK